MNCTSVYYLLRELVSLTSQLDISISLEFLTFDDIVYTFKFFIIFNVFLLRLGRTSVNIFNVPRATGLSVVHTVMCYPREMKSLSISNFRT